MEEQTRYPGKYCKFTLNGRVVKSCLSSSSIPVTSYYLLKIINFFFVSAITNFQLDKIEFKMKLQFHFSYSQRSERKFVVMFYVLDFLLSKLCLW